MDHIDESVLQFFFSSRRRHTRFKCDWSSDVCSSDLVAEANGLGLLGSGLTEAGIGLAASLHLYSTLELVLPPELNGPKFLEDLFVDGLVIHDNTVTVPDGPGLGAEGREAEIRRPDIRIYAI